MSADRTEYLNGLITELRKLPAETTWLEFKENNINPDDIGQYISALSNAAALAGKANAYIVWGVKDDTHEVVGTTFKPFVAKGKGNEDLENWLNHTLEPRLHFRFYELTYEGRPVVFLEISSAFGRPVQFQGVEFIRVGSYRQKLKDNPQIESQLWRTFDSIPFEAHIALEQVDGAEALTLLDYPSYFDLLKQPLPGDRDAILVRLADDRMVVPNQAGGWNVTNLGAILLAKNLDKFKWLARKAVRIVVYEGNGRLKAVRELTGDKGYAAGFNGLMESVNTLLPRKEVVGQALRKSVPMFPELAVRELIANAIIHQDFSIAGAGPMIEIFDDRIEITNPGKPLMSPERFLDTPPRSRNEALASFMRRIGICEERGSGVDKVVSETEVSQLPAPIFETTDDSTKAVLFAHKSLNDMDKSDRIRACYLHACLRFVEHDPMTNSSLRQRFKIASQNSAIASRIIRETLEEGRLKPLDPKQGKKHAKYVPFWA